MSKRAAGLYQSNTETVRLHQRIVELQRDGLTQKEIAKRIPMHASTVEYHLTDYCNCNNRNGH